MGEKKGASFNTKDFIVGGLLDDVDVTWVNVKCEMYDYGGKADAAPCVGADLVTGDEEGAPVRQYWSVGNADNWEPSEDGKYMIPVGKDSGFRKGSNVFLLLKSLEEAGFPMERFNDGDITALEGLRTHMVRKPAPKREGFTQTVRRGQDGKEFENKILLVESIITLPGEAAAAATPVQKAKAAAKTKAATKAKSNVEPQAEAAEADVSLDDKAKEILTMLIVEGGGAVSKKDIPSQAFKVMGTDPARNKVLALLFKDEWISGNGFTISAEGEISLG